MRNGRHFLVASHPDSPAAAFAACWDLPNWRSEAERFQIEYEAKGAVVRRVTPAEGKRMLDRYDGRGL